MEPLGVTKYQRRQLLTVLKRDGCKAAKRLAEKYTGRRVHLSTVPQMKRRGMKKQKISQRTY